MLWVAWRIYMYDNNDSKHTVQHLIDNWIDKFFDLQQLILSPPKYALDQGNNLEIQVE